MAAGLWQWVLRVFLGLASLVVSRALLLAAHEVGWQPEEWLAKLLMVSPQTTVWVLSAILAVALFFSADWFLYRRQKTGRAGVEGSPTPRPDWPVIEVVQHIQRVQSLPEDRLDDALTDIRQAARLGEVTVWGRPYAISVGIDQLYKPREPIPEEHWRNYGFDVPRCLFDDPRRCGTEPDNERSHPKYKCYVDLQMSSEQVRARWT
jgi:hypothetical protein